MSHALGPHTGSDIFRGKFSKITKKSTKPLLRPDCRQIVVQQNTQTAAHMYTECNVLFSLALQLLLDLCLFCKWKTTTFFL